MHDQGLSSQLCIFPMTVMLNRLNANSSWQFFGCSVILLFYPLLLSASNFIHYSTGYFWFQQFVWGGQLCPFFLGHIFSMLFVILRICWFCFFAITLTVVWRTDDVIETPLFGKVFVLLGYEPLSVIFIYGVPYQAKWTLLYCMMVSLKESSTISSSQKSLL